MERMWLLVSGSNSGSIMVQSRFMTYWSHKSRPTDPALRMLSRVLSLAYLIINGDGIRMSAVAFGPLLMSKGSFRLSNGML